ncbi:metal-sensing transcriptional repressor [Microbacterium sp. Root280D1]|uniref:metal-sensing transcriptional repressor n=1 Tax=Microbacterium sp. Root280D1 TaxID=1736510 RepID=UPI0009EBFCBC
MNGYESNKADLRKRLSRVEGQVRGIARMVDEDKYCIDILTQVSAATKALETVALSLLSDHLAHCVAQASAVLVAGMTCSHCASSVSDELNAIDGVDGVTVDLNAGGASRVIVHSAAPIDPTAVRAAVEEAGYTLATSPI